MTLSEKVSAFKAYLEKKTAFDNALSLLYFDQSTLAPKGGAAARAKTIGVLAGESFALSVSDVMKGHIDALGAHVSELDAQTRAMLRICERDYTAMENIPKAEFAAYSELVSNAELVWEDAKSKKDYSLFVPVLTDIVAYLRRFIEYRDRGAKGHPYNTLLDDYEPGLTTDILDAFFDEQKAGLSPILAKIEGSSVCLSDAPAQLHVPRNAQEKISRLLMEELGFDFERGLLSTSEHPFSSGMGKGDVRITTNYNENSFFSSFFSIMHETGHALYEQNTDDSLAGTILDTGISMGIHESQSRFYENIIGRSYAFWEYITDKLLPLLPAAFSGFTPKDFFVAANKATPSPIRIEADELTYNFHIIIRYETEKALFGANPPAVKELGEIWNEKYKKYLGITPKNDAEGILQDIHWSSGLFGYFPSYALGGAYAAQLYHYMNDDFNVNNAVQNGDLAKITSWLTDKIHKHGSVCLPADLIMNIKNERLNGKYLIDYLNEKYDKIY